MRRNSKQAEPFDPVLGHVLYGSINVPESQRHKIEDKSVLEKILTEIENTNGFRVSTEYLGGHDPNPGEQKRCTVFWRESRDRPMLTISAPEGAEIKFDDYVCRVTWQYQLVTQWWVYDRFNQVYRDQHKKDEESWYQKFLPGRTTPWAIAITNDSMGGKDPEPGQEKFAAITIRHHKPEYWAEEYTIKEGNIWPEDTLRTDAIEI